jgi:glycosyltransferase involved in cell wall biosynthesis
VSDRRPLVSVVVPTRDAARTITRCLESVLAQTWPAVELVVVDNRSSDGTWEVAGRLAHVAVQGGPERSAQRNLGVERAGGEWVLWVDADMVLAPDTVERSLEAAHAGGAAAVFLPEVSVGSGFWARCRALERRCYHREPRIEAPRLVRTDVLRDAGGFDTGLTGTEDAALRNRLLSGGVGLAWADTVVVHDEGRLRLAPVLRKRFSYGGSLPRYHRTNPGAVKAQASGTLAAYWRHRRLLAADPLHAAGLAALRACETVAWAAGAATARRR